MAQDSYLTRGGIRVDRTIQDVAVAGAVEPLVDALDSRRGVLLTSGFEYPGRYSRWDIGFVNPPLCVTSRAYEFRIEALNERGAVLLPAIERQLTSVGALRELARDGAAVRGRVQPSAERFPEEMRSKQPTVFTVLRALVELFASEADPHLGLYGAFGYDLALQFEPLRLRLSRAVDQRDLVLYVPDEILVVDHRREHAMVRTYEFTVEPSPAAAGDGGARASSTAGLARTGTRNPRPNLLPAGEGTSDHKPGEYAANVSLAREAFRRGDLFEVVLSQTLSQPCEAPPSELFRRLRERNPAPYGFLVNLGQDEHLVGASPEMYVRVDGERVETCPLSGTIARGADPLADAARIRELLNSKKDESELTMCTDVDRNDKSRICRPGTIQVIGRRQIELYSRLIHTADHVEGMLAPEYDAMDAFLTHAWAVTVTGAPKRWAMQFVEDHEKSARAWYGGAVGLIGFDGNMNTGLTLRTVRIKDGRAEVRVGATLLYDSDPEAEEAETRLKASALVDAVRLPVARQLNEGGRPAASPGAGKRVLLVDHEDSFVHTLADYFRQTGCAVTTLRAGFPYTELDAIRPDLVVLSPGPGQPSDFNVSATLAACVQRGLPVFGVCLGLQGMIQHFGGRLGLLDEPVHGKASAVCVQGESRLFRDLPRQFEAGRYHSLYARPEWVPAALAVTAVTEDGVVMAVEHRTLPLAGIQFHPESIMTLGASIGLRLIHNVVAELAPSPTVAGEG